MMGGMLSCTSEMIGILRLRAGRLHHPEILEVEEVAGLAVIVEFRLDDGQVSLFDFHESREDLALVTQLVDHSGVEIRCFLSF